MIKTLFAALVVSQLSGFAFGQQGETQPSKAARAKSESLLFARDRERMHPGDPLRLVGIEEGGRDIRSETPALARTDYHSTMLDPTELRKRALDVYEQMQVYTEPTRSAVETPAPVATPASSEPPVAPHQGIPMWLSIIGMGLAVSGLAFALLGRRSTRE